MSEETKKHVADSAKKSPGKTPEGIKMDDVRAKAEERKCPVQKTLVFIEEFLAGPMCGKCFPCSLGSYEVRIRVKRLSGGTSTEDDLTALRRIATHMLEASMCKKGKDTARFILENIDLSEYAGHLSGGCASRECKELVEYIIIPELCTLCGECQEVCKDNAIIGEKRKPYLSGYLPFEIVQKRCTKCGECIKVCPYSAIELISSKKMTEKESAKV
ncbi:MAG: NADH-ubiquinone oxidoreductase-F iron-sulfur binding region domain-containing protein [Thermodesulfovibrionia bacterium]